MASIVAQPIKPLLAMLTSLSASLHSGGFASDPVPSPWEHSRGCPKRSCPYTYIGKTDESLGLWFPTSPALAAVAICGVNQQMADESALSLPMSLSLSFK